MAKSNYLDYSDSLNWNVAKGFAERMILNPIIECRNYETIARFGTLEIVDQLMTDESVKNVSRFVAIERLLYTLIDIIHNSKFAIKKKDKDSVEELKKSLMKIKKVLPGLRSTIVNQKLKSKVIKIHEVNFEIVLNMLAKIRADLLIPLNQADLIFSSDDSIDPDEFMAKLKEDMIHSG